jgi:hypothetical protein
MVAKRSCKDGPGSDTNRARRDRKENDDRQPDNEERKQGREADGALCRDLVVRGRLGRLLLVGLRSRRRGWVPVFFGSYFSPQDSPPKLILIPERKVNGRAGKPNASA